ncbi:hypothetical protein ACSSS7_000132 [Eimeria intestinalis]
MGISLWGCSTVLLLLWFPRQPGAAAGTTENGWEQAPVAPELHEGPPPPTSTSEEVKHDWRSLWTYDGGASLEGNASEEDGGRVPDEIDGRRLPKKKEESEDSEEEDPVVVERVAGRAPPSRAADSDDASRASETEDEETVAGWTDVQARVDAVRGTKATLWGTVLLLLSLLRLSGAPKEEGREQQQHTDSLSPFLTAVQPQGLNQKDSNLTFAGFGLGLMASGVLEMLVTKDTKHLKAREKKGASKGGRRRGESPPPRVRGLSLLLAAMLLSCYLPKQQQQLLLQHQQLGLERDDDVDSTRLFPGSTAKLSFAIGIALAGIALIVGTATLRLDHYLKHGGSVASFFGMQKK